MSKHKTLVDFDKIVSFLNRNPKYVSSVLDRKQILAYINNLPKYELDSDEINHLVCNGDKNR